MKGMWRDKKIAGMQYKEERLYTGIKTLLAALSNTGNNFNLTITKLTNADGVKKGQNKNHSHHSKPPICEHNKDQVFFLSHPQSHAGNVHSVIKTQRTRDMQKKDGGPL